jgi:hypothetical protein
MIWDAARLGDTKGMDMTAMTNKSSRGQRRRNAALALMCAVTAALLLMGGCAPSGADSQENSEIADTDASADGAENTAESPSDTQPDAEGSASAPDFSALRARFPEDTVIMTVNGEDVLWDEYFFTVYAIVSNVISSNGSIPGWEEFITADMTFGQFMTDTIYRELITPRAIASGASELGLSLSEAELAEIDAQLASMEEQLGGKEALEEYFETMYCSEKLYRWMMEANYEQRLCFDALYGENGEKTARSDLEQYADDNGYMMAKHILKLTMDMNTRQPLPEDEIVAARESAEAILGELDAYSGDDFNGFFDELMNANSEDTGLQSNPGGYLFVPGEMVVEFENATRELEPGKYSGIVETAYGLHIIYRLPVDYDAATSSGETLRYVASGDIFNKTVAETWRDGLDVKLGDVYDSLGLELAKWFEDGSN